MLNNIVQRAINLGVNESWSVQKNKNIRMMNVYTYAAVGNTLPIGIIMAFFDLMPVVIANKPTLP